MSEDKTKFTLETLARQIESLTTEMRAGFAAVDTRLTAIETRLTHVESQLENMDIRFDEISSFAHQTRSEILSLRSYVKGTRATPPIARTPLRYGEATVDPPTGGGGTGGGITRTSDADPPSGGGLTEKDKSRS